MATATMATTAGAALLYYTLNHKMIVGPSDVDDENSETYATRASLRMDHVSHRLIQAPVTWLETISTLSETLRFTYSETLGKWPIGDLAFGINFLIKRQGLLHVDHVFGGKDSIELKGSKVATELTDYLHLLTLCWHFSKKSFLLFLNVLIHEPKAGILKPAFTVLFDHNSKCFLLLIRGTHSVKDTLTAATGGIVSFHYTVVNERGVSNLILGYAHCGMVAAARCIAKLSTPCLLKGLEQYPNYKIKIVGHSLGGGTAALLTYILREQKMLSTSTCVTFAPAACMTWELADSGKDFIVSIINGDDLVPTFSAASVDDLRAELALPFPCLWVASSAWLSELRNRIESTQILSTVYRSTTTLGSRLPSMATAKAKFVSAGAMLRPVSSGTQVVMRRARSMLARPAVSLSSWSCIRPRRSAPATQSNSGHQLDSSEAMSKVRLETLDHFLVSTRSDSADEEITEKWKSEGECFNYNEAFARLGATGLDECEDQSDIDSREEQMTEVELWQQLEHDLYHEDSLELPEEADVATKIKKEEVVIADAGVAQPEIGIHEMKESHRFLPPGKIMHIVTFRSGAMEANEEDDGSAPERLETVEEGRVGIFLTPRSLYSKVRLTDRMISDHFMPVYRRHIERLIQELMLEQS